MSDLTRGAAAMRRLRLRRIGLLPPLPTCITCGRQVRSATTAPLCSRCWRLSPAGRESNRQRMATKRRNTASGSIDHRGTGCHHAGVQRIPPMNNPWIKRFAVLVMMFGFYGIGIAAGRDQATLVHHQHPACHPNLKP